MLLCFPLDFQTRAYLEQAVNLFGNVLTWTNNDHCKTRVLMRCSVLHATKIPRSIIVCCSAVVGGAGQSWTVPVFVLNSVNNEVLPVDEDPLPHNGNPHPMPGQQNEDHHQHDWFDDIQDLQAVDQANLDEGWEPLMPNVAPAAVNANDWGDWQQEGEQVDENELHEVQGC
jgi:hypothetical protein